MRAACIRYLQTWFWDFYRSQPDLAGQFEALARELGGGLVTPQFSWKYAWIHRLFGWEVAKHSTVALRQFNASILRRWDEMLYRFETKRPRDVSSGDH